MSADALQQALAGIVAGAGELGNIFGIQANLRHLRAVCASGLSTRKLVYSQDITLDAATYASPGGYYAAMERCYRNLAIANIVNSGGAARLLS